VTGVHRRKSRFSIRRFLSGLLGAVLSAMALALLAAFVLSMLGVARFVPVLSNSMAPEMPVGSLVVALPEARPTIDTGDVIIFTAPIGPSRRVIHRVINTYEADEADRIVGWTSTKRYMETKGDNNPTADPWIVTIGDDIIWRASYVVHDGGWPAIWLGDPRIRFAAFGVAGAAVVGWALIVLWRRPEEPTSG
jgi:signal peptidase